MHIHQKKKLLITTAHCRITGGSTTCLSLHEMPQYNDVVMAAALFKNNTGVKLHTSLCCHHWDYSKGSSRYCYAYEVWKCCHVHMVTHTRLQHRKTRTSTAQLLKCKCYAADTYCSRGHHMQPRSQPAMFTAGFPPCIKRQAQATGHDAGTAK